MNCYICNNTELQVILDLGLHPPPLEFVTNESLKIKKQSKFPLKLALCEKCGLVQLEQAIDPDLMFKNYTYTSSASQPFVQHLNEFAKKVTEIFNLNEKDLVIDIASNDGTLLQGFKKFNVKTLGVEPSNIANLAKKSGIDTEQDYFNEKCAKKIESKYGKAKIITATNVFAHIHDINSVMKGIKIILDEKGVFVSESHYLRDLIEKLEYDTIYHEHVRYYGLTQLKKLFEKFNMEIFDVERISSHGGSIRVYASNKGQFDILKSVEQMLLEEEKIDLTSHQTLSKFAERVQENKIKLNKLLLEIKSSGKKIVGISAPARSSTILNFCEINSDMIDYITEVGEFKIGKLTPGTYIPVVNDEKLITDQPEFALLLSWHLKDPIMKKLKDKGYKGKFIIPLPSPEIV